MTESGDDVKIAVNEDWTIQYKIDGGNYSKYVMPLAEGEYGKDELRVTCVMLLRAVLFGSDQEAEDREDDKYIIYEIIADTEDKTISFDLEILDDDSEIEFAIDGTKSDILKLMDYEQNRVIKAKD